MESAKRKTPSGCNRKGHTQVPDLHSTNDSISAQSAFKHAMESAGLQTKDAVMADGRLHRFHVHGDRTGTKNGWYVLYPAPVPAGAFGCWKRQILVHWHMQTKRRLTAAQRRHITQQTNAARQKWATEEAVRQEQAIARARQLWAKASPAANDHPYLVRKMVQSHGLRTLGTILVLPLYNKDKTLCSLQFIDRAGNKRFLSGGKKKGSFFVIGTIGASFCIAEGYATAASIHAATGLAVVVAFDAGNLLPVARIFRAQFPTARITICADNDTKTTGNPGLTKAREAAQAIGGLLAIPPCSGDFNDLLTEGVTS